MSEKKLTPIQELLNEVRDKILFLPPAQDMSDFAKGKDAILHEIEERLNDLLPKEKEFARDMWEASFDWHYNNAYGPVPNPKLDFENYFIQYEP